MAALVVGGLGVDGAPEGALGRGHIARQEGRRLARHARRLRIAGAGMLAGVELEQEAVVVEQLLEMRPLPLAVGGIAVEAAGRLVVEASARPVVEARSRRLTAHRPTG